MGGEGYGGVCGLGGWGVCGNPPIDVVVYAIVVDVDVVVDIIVIEIVDVDVDVVSYSTFLLSGVYF